MKTGFGVIDNIAILIGLLERIGLTFYLRIDRHACKQTCKKYKLINFIHKKNRLSVQYYV